MLAHQVDPGDLLGDRVLDLQPGVDLEEARSCRPAPTRNSQVPGADVAGLAQDRLGRRGTAASAARRSGTAPGPPRRASGGGAAASSRGWRRRPRCRARRRGTGSRRAAAGPGSARRSTRRGRTRPPPRGPRSRTARRSRSSVAGDLEAAAAAAERRLDGDRQAVPARERDDLVGPADRAGGAGRQRGADRAGDVPGAHLVAQRLDGGRRRADPGQPGVDDGLGEVGVLGQEAVARVHRVGAARRPRRRGSCRCPGSSRPGWRPPSA